MQSLASASEYLDCSPRDVPPGPAHPCLSLALQTHPAAVEKCLTVLSKQARLGLHCDPNGARPQQMRFDENSDSHVRILAQLKRSGLGTSRRFKAGLRG